MSLPWVIFSPQHVNDVTVVRCVIAIKTKTGLLVMEFPAESVCRALDTNVTSLVYSPTLDFKFFSFLCMVRVSFQFSIQVV